jgi:hypothetical protein
MTAAQPTTMFPDAAEADRAKALGLLGEVLSSRVRATLLAWVVPRLDARFSLTELSRDVGSPISSLQHECYKLERLGVLQGRRDGASRRYHVQLDHHLSRPLVSLVIASLGLQAVLAEAVSDVGQVDAAAIAAPDPSGANDRLVLVLIGDVDLEGLDRAVQRVAMLLDADPDHIDLAFFRRDDWLEYGASGHPLLARLAGRPIQTIVGPWPPTLE